VEGVLPWFGRRGATNVGRCKELRAVPSGGQRGNHYNNISGFHYYVTSLTSKSYLAFKVRSVTKQDVSPLVVGIGDPACWVDPEEART
jgi:hypothetical protein